MVGKNDDDDEDDEEFEIVDKDVKPLDGFVLELLPVVCA